MNRDLPHRNVVFRNLESGDYDRIIALWDLTGLPIRPRGRDSRREIIRLMNRDPDLFIGSFIDDNLVGVLIGTDDGRKGWLNRLAVHPDYQNKGIGKALVMECEKRFKDRGRQIIAVNVEEWNEISLQFFLGIEYVLHRDILYLTKRENDDV